jgi:excisionase family DNA binding protein
VPEPLMTVRDLADYLGCGRDLAYALVAAGSVPSIRLAPGGRAIRIRPEAVAAWLRDQEREGRDSNAASGSAPLTAFHGGHAHAQPPGRL